MRQPSKEMVILYEHLRKTTDKKEIEQLQKKIKELAKEERKDWPFE